ncbi:MAG: Rrf2 family transcriptional regulator [Deltaproteobacteria bacterium]|nr:Rrf2 family transcriptional regulator [Deltaproteobacteria bacterium]
MPFSISEAANLAIHALTYLAGQRSSGPVSTAQVARHYGVSEAHLSKVFQRLTKAGFVKSIRGPKGGFVLAEDPSAITLKDIYESIDGPLSRRSLCLLGRRSCDLDRCIFGDLLESIHKQVTEKLSGTTLAALIRKP